MVRSPRVVVVLLLLLRLLVPGFAGRADAADAADTATIGDDVRSEALGHYERGKVLFASEDYVAAAVEFAQTDRMLGPFALDKDGRIIDADVHDQRRRALSNAATSYSRAELPVEALDAFTRLRDLYSALLSGDEQALIDAAIARLKDRIGLVSLKNLPEGAEARIDGRMAPAEAGVRAFQLAAGDHVIEVVARGYRPFVAHFAVAAGATIDVPVQLGALESPPRVRVESTVDPATVTLDGEELGPAPVELDVTPGRHEYKVASESYVEQTGSFTAVAGERAFVQVGLVPRRAPLGVRIEPYFGGYVANRFDTPLGKFDMGFGLRLFHSYVRYAGIQIGLQFEGHSRELDRFGFGTIINWCPDRFAGARKASRWCPISLTALKTIGGEIGPFTGGENAGRIATSAEADFGPIFFRFALGTGYEQYKRSGLVPLSVGVTFVEVSVGMDL